MKCNNCNYLLPDDSEFCPYCGNHVDSNLVQEKPAGKEKKGKKWTTIVISVLSTILAITIGKFVGGYIAELTWDGYSTKTIEKDIEDYNDDLGDTYIPGKMYGKRYVSEHFGLVFDFDENWELMTDAELEEFAKAAREGGISNAMQTEGYDDIPENLREGLLDSFYADTETGAYYYNDEGYNVANVSISVLSVYGIDEMDTKEIADMMAAEYRTLYDETERSTQYAGGEQYEVIEVRTVQNGAEVELDQYIRKEKGMVCIVQYVGAVGFDDEAEANFKEMLGN